jgi:CubicO group peptidase (beta-lactamase class C family)
MVSVQGTVAAGYESVRSKFQQHVDDGIQDCGQLCVYVKGKRVVDLWTCPPDSDYGPSHVQNVFSSSKSLTSLVIAMLVDRKRLSYDTLVTDLWPEYEQHGKSSTTVATVMRHEAGLAKFNQDLPISDLVAQRLREGSVSDVIASQKPAHEPGTQRNYHALSRGWIVNEIVMRADEHGRTIGQFLHDEVAMPLELQDELCIGVPAELDHKVKDLSSRLQADLWFNWWQLLLPRALGGGKVPLQSNVLRMLVLAAVPLYEVGVIGLLLKARQAMNTPPSIDDRPRYFVSFVCVVCLSHATSHTAFRSGMGIRLGQSDLAPGQKLSTIGQSPAAFFNTEAMRRGESPSANGHASGRALAKVAAAIVGGGVSPAEGEDGSTGSTRIISEAGLAEAHADEVYFKLFGVMVSGLFSHYLWSHACGIRLYLLTIYLLTIDRLPTGHLVQQRRLE